MKLKGIHHVAIICRDLNQSLSFYVDLLGFTVERTIYREERDSYKVDLQLNGTYLLELFTFPNAPARPSYPEAQGLRHLAFATDDLEAVQAHFKENNYPTESIRIDDFTGKKFFFVEDPDNLPIEFYES